MLEIILFIVVTLNIIAILGLISMFIYGYLTNNKQQPPITRKKVTIIVPCKGLVHNLENNLKAICTQQYPNYQILFVIDSTADPAYPLIDNIINSIPNTNVEITKKIPTASGKIAALLTGIQKTKDTDIYVFADSDTQPHPNWLTHLVCSLSDNDIGATTGFRWYFPTSIKDTLIATWNMATIAALFHPLSNYTWGGSTAIKKETFDKLQIKQKWRTGFSDDLILTRIVKKAGLIIKFVPQCIIESPEDTDIKTFIKWGTQQFTWMRWYNPIIYYPTFIVLLLIHLLLPFGFILLLSGQIFLGILMILPLFFEMIYGLTGIVVLKKLMLYPKEKFGKSFLYSVLMPLIFLLYTYNFILSSIKQEIKWGDTYYKKKDLP